jgi:hypothetical protein
VGRSAAGTDEGDAEAAGELGVDAAGAATWAGTSGAETAGAGVGDWAVTSGIRAGVTGV